MLEIELGSEVLDPITGYKGIAIGRTIWLYGCSRITVQMKGLDKDGNLYPTQSFDEPQLKLVKKAVLKTGNRKTGGFNIKIEQKKGVSRF